jgi:hypothetical protein
MHKWMQLAQKVQIRNAVAAAWRRLSNVLGLAWRKLSSVFRFLRRRLASQPTRYRLTLALLTIPLIVGYLTIDRYFNAASNQTVIQ